MRSELSRLHVRNVAGFRIKTGGENTPGLHRWRIEGLMFPRSAMRPVLFLQVFVRVGGGESEAVIRVVSAVFGRSWRSQGEVMSGLVTRQIGRWGSVVAQRISISLPTDPSSGPVALIFNIVGCQAVPEGLVANKTKEYFLQLSWWIFTVRSSQNFSVEAHCNPPSWSWACLF